MPDGTFVEIARAAMLYAAGNFVLSMLGIVASVPYRNLFMMGPNMPWVNKEGMSRRVCDIDTRIVSWTDLQRLFGGDQRIPT